MSDTLNKILLPSVILSMLKEEAGSPKAVIVPGSKNQRITKLVNPASGLRIFESVVHNPNRDASAPPNRVLMLFDRSAIRHVNKTLDFVIDNAPATVEIKSSNKKGGAVYLYASNPDKLKHEAGRVDRDHIVHRFSTEGCEDVLVSEPIILDLLTHKYADEELMGLDELMRSPYQVFVIDEEGNERELNAEARCRVRPTDSIVFTIDDSHAEYTYHIWQREVLNSNTQLGYNDWVHQQIDVAESAGHPEPINVVDAIVGAIENGKPLFKVRVGEYKSEGETTPMSVHTLLIAVDKNDNKRMIAQAACEKEYPVHEHYFAPVSDFMEVLSKEALSSIAMLVRESAPESVSAIVNRFTTMNISGVTDEHWIVDGQAIDSDQLMFNLIDELYKKSPENLKAVMDEIEYDNQCLLSLFRSSR